MQPQTFIFFGQVGSGKGTQVKLLMDFLKAKDGKECLYLGTGDGFRKIMEAGNYAGQLVKEKLSRGELMDDFFANSIIASGLADSLKEGVHLITDGYPRTVAQSQTFEKMLEFYKRNQVKIIYIELSEQEAMKRNLLRGRHDDTEEGLRKRFNEYANKVIPAMNYFKDKDDYTIFTINGEQSIENVHQEIINKLAPSLK